MNVYDIADIESGNPNATRKGIRAVIDKAVLDDDNNIIGFIIRYSSWHKSGSGYFMLPCYDRPQTDCDDRYAVRTDSGEVFAYACPLGCEQTDCAWK